MYENQKGRTLQQLHVRIRGRHKISVGRKFLLFDANTRTQLIDPLAPITRDYQLGAGQSGGSCDTAHLHISEALAYAQHANLSAAVVFLDLSTAFASMQRDIAVPAADAKDEEWAAHLHRCGFSPAEISAILALACSVLVWRNAGADHHALMQLAEAHSGTWISMEGLATIVVF